MGQGKSCSLWLSSDNKKAASCDFHPTTIKKAVACDSHLNTKGFRLWLSSDHKSKKLLLVTLIRQWKSCSLWLSSNNKKAVACDSHLNTQGFSLWLSFDYTSKNRLRGSKPSAFTLKTSLLLYNRTNDGKYLPDNFE